MPTKKCADCGGVVATSVFKCPHCGSTTPHKLQRYGWFGCGAVLVVCILLVGGTLLKSCNAPVSPAKPSAPLDPAKQAERKKLLDELIVKGIFQKIDQPAQYPHAWVTPQFHALDYETKKAFVSVVFAYYYPDGDPSGMVILKDSKTGKSAGTYSLNLGLRL